MEQEQKSFNDYLNDRIQSETTEFFKLPVIQKAYFTGAYAKSVIQGSYYSEVSKENSTFKRWLSNQIINYRNLDRIFEIAFRFEQKLRLTIRNDSEVRKLAHEVPMIKSVGISSAKISFAFVAGFDDYAKFVKETPSNIVKDDKDIGTK